MSTQALELDMLNSFPVLLLIFGGVSGKPA
jgi:hypothetical protein